MESADVKIEFFYFVSLITGSFFFCRMDKRKFLSGEPRANEFCRNFIKILISRRQLHRAAKLRRVMQRTRVREEAHDDRTARRLIDGVFD